MAAANSGLVEGDYSGTFLTAVLEGMKSVIKDLGGVLDAVYTDDTHGIIQLERRV